MKSSQLVVQLFKIKDNAEIEFVVRVNHPPKRETVKLNLIAVYRTKDLKTLRFILREQVKKTK